MVQEDREITGWEGNTPRQSGLEWSGSGGEPFSPGAPRSSPSAASHWALLGCGALILLLGIGSLVFLIKARDLFSWMMGKLEAEVMRALPADFSDSERLELSAAFRAAVDAVRDDRANALALQELQEVLREALQEDGDRLSREEIQELIEALDRVSGRGGPGAGGASENSGAAVSGSMEAANTARESLSSPSSAL